MGDESKDNTRSRFIRFKAVPPVKSTFLEEQILSVREQKPCNRIDQRKVAYAFPPFLMIPRVLNKVQMDQVKTMILIAPTW